MTDVSTSDGVMPDSGMRGMLARKVKESPFEKIETVTLSGIRAEGSDTITLQRVRELILDTAESAFEEAVEGQVSAAKVRGYLAALLGFAVVPVVAIFG